MLRHSVSNKYITKYITEPTVIGDLDPVATQAISTEAIDLLEIDIPSFEDRDGPIRYCKHTYSECVLYLFHTAVTTSLWSSMLQYVTRHLLH